MLWIQAMGLGSPLGPLATGCAALRAGVSRFGPSREFSYMAEGDNAPTPLVTSAMGAATFGFFGIGRLVAALAEAILDLRAGCGAAGLPKDTIPFLVLPDPLDRALPMRAELQEDAEARATALGRAVAEQLAGVVGPPQGAGAWRLFVGGREGLASALVAAEAAAAERRQAVLVAIADSWLSQVTLERLVLERRAKTEDQPTGFVPGEAAAALLLDRGPRPKAPAVAVRSARVSVAATHDNPGRTLAALVAAAVGAQPGRTPPLLVSDHNGEAWRADEWGHFLVHLRRARPEWRLESVFPATGFGDCGVASPALGVCVAARALSRHALETERALVLASEESGPRAVIELARSDGVR